MASRYAPIGEYGVIGDAIATTRRLAREVAIFAGLSSGSITWAALSVAKRPENKGKLIVSIIAGLQRALPLESRLLGAARGDYSDLAPAIGE